MLMMLDITDALPLILEGSGRRTELQIPTMLALLFALRSLWRRRDGYRIRKKANRNERNHGVGRGVDDQDGRNVYGKARSSPHLSSGYHISEYSTKSTCNNRNGRNHDDGDGVDDQDDRGLCNHLR